MDCPSCKTGLRSGFVEGIEIDECAACHGIWFDDQELRQAKNLADPDLHWLDFELWQDEEHFERVEGVACPRCSKATVGLRYGVGGVQIDHCPGCRGFWLEKGEFAKLIEALHDEVARMSSREYLAAALHEAGEVLDDEEPLASKWKDFHQILRLFNLRLLIEKPGLRQALLQVQRGTPFG